jgi:tRNA uridine 5-carboxymethylaminomethyl modification enzyme
MRRGRESGLVDDATWGRFEEKLRLIDKLRGLLAQIRRGERSLLAALKSPEVRLAQLIEEEEELRVASYPPAVVEAVEIEVKYEGYISRQEDEVERLRRLEEHLIPTEVDYWEIPELRREAREKLSKVQPRTLGQAGRISGIGPAELSILRVYLEGRRRFPRQRSGQDQP